MFTRPLFQARRLSARGFSTGLLLAVVITVLLSQEIQADPINWRHNLDSALVEANRTGKLVLLHFYTSSCGPCKKLERDVFSQPQIAAAMEKDFVPVKLNADDSPAYANQYQITRVPSEVVLTPQGNIVQKLSCPLEPSAYGSQLANVAQHYGQRSANRLVAAQAPIHSAYAGLKIGPPSRPQASTAIRPANNAPTLPAVTQNPYVKGALLVAPPQVTQQQPSVPPAPVNAIQNRYGGRYAEVATQARPVVKKPVAQPTQAAVIQAQITSPIVAAVPAAAAPTIAKTTIPAAAPPATTTPPSTQQVATTPPVAAKVWPPKLPAGTPELAFDGYCPVSLQEAQKWVRGRKTFGAIHRGRTYLFAGEGQRKKFLTTPDAFSPVFSGYDPVQMLDENKQVAGIRKFGYEYRGAFYLFSSKETMARFASQPDRYSAGVRQAMNRMDTAAGGTIRR